MSLIWKYLSQGKGGPSLGVEWKLVFHPWQLGQSFLVLVDLRMGKVNFQFFSARWVNFRWVLVTRVSLLFQLRKISDWFGN